MFSKNVLNYNIFERGSTLRFSMNALWHECKEVQQHLSSQVGRMMETCNKYNKKIDTWDTCGSTLETSGILGFRE